jgi:hypothetical protein
MKQASTREVLLDLARTPIGSRELQDEADRKARRGIKPSAELQETIDRCKRKWLPQGKRTVSRADQREAEAAFYANQTDLEDAIEAAGGKRGSLSRQ